MHMSLIQLKRAANILGLDSLPGLLPVDHIATLQTHDDPIPDSFTRTQANLRRWGRAGLWGDTMRADIEAGGLPHTTTTTERKMVSPPRDVEPNPCGFGDHPAWATRDGVRLAYTVEAVYQDTTTHHIAAPDFARWLASQGEQPSRLIAAWFKSQGVGDATEPQPAPAEQVKPESTSERDHRWLDVWDKESPQHLPGSQAKAIAFIVMTEGVNADTVKKGLQRAKKARQEAHREGVARLLPGQKKAPKKAPAAPFSGLTKRG